MIQIREAGENDVEGIRDVFRSCYGETYAYPQYYDLHFLKKMVFEDDTLLLVVEDAKTGRILGSASVILELGAHGDLVGEFGRLAVHPEGRHRGIGKQLMEGRLKRIEDRLHLAIIENRVVHPFSQRISARFGFVAAGFLPMKLRFQKRESLALYIRHFDAALGLRKNHPRVISEAYPLAAHVLAACGCTADAVADDEAAAYPYQTGFVLKSLTTEGYTSLLRLERGRIRHREIFGPVRLHTGLFRIRVRHANYLLACEGDQVCGGIGYTLDEVERAVQIFELVSVDSRPIHFLLAALEEQCRNDGRVDYIEADVNAHAPAMQRTLLELGFLPVGYIPAMVFHLVERLDAVKMARLPVPLELDGPGLHTSVEPIADLVLNAFIGKDALPLLEAVAKESRLLAGLTDEQVRTLAAIARQTKYETGTVVFQESERAEALCLVVRGGVEIRHGADNRCVGSVCAGQALGEIALLRGMATHTATVVATSETELIELPHADLRSLLRRRPDIGAVLYRNLATLLGEKLMRADDNLLATVHPMD